MIIADFSGDRKTVYAEGLWQWDYGQTLRIQGLKLPTAVEIHFSLSEAGGTAITRIGLTEDSVTDVVIPDHMLENELKTTNYRIYAFIYLTNESSGETIYQVICTVKARPKPEAYQKQEDGDIFREALRKINEIASRIDDDITTAKESAAAISAAVNLIEQEKQGALDALKTLKETQETFRTFADTALETVKTESEETADNAAAAKAAMEVIQTIAQTITELGVAAEIARNQAESAKRAAEEAQQGAQEQAAIATEKAEQFMNATAVTDLFEVVNGILCIR